MSPDLNPIENLWGIVARDVYAYGRQFSSVDELKRQIQCSWFSMDPTYIHNLISSMPDRIFQTIRSNGATNLV